jgi:hypothetical protein
LVVDEEAGSINHEKMEQAEEINKEALASNRNDDGLEVEQDVDDPPCLRTDVKVAEQLVDPPPHAMPDLAPRLGLACHCF